MVRRPSTAPEAPNSSTGWVLEASGIPLSPLIRMVYGHIWENLFAEFEFRNEGDRNLPCMPRVYSLRWEVIRSLHS
jgi:hypothetical protein